MRGLFDLHDPTSSRMDIAVEKLAAGSGFAYENVWFRREGDELWCSAISPWHGPGLSEPEALQLIEGAREALDFLVANSHLFSAAAAGLRSRFMIIRDDELSWDVVAELIDDRLVWRLHQPEASA